MGFPNSSFNIRLIVFANPLSENCVAIPVNEKGEVFASFLMSGFKRFKLKKTLVKATNKNVTSSSTDIIL